MLNHAHSTEDTVMPVMFIHIFSASLKVYLALGTVSAVKCCVLEIVALGFLELTASKVQRND